MHKINTWKNEELPDLFLTWTLFFFFCKRKDNPTPKRKGRKRKLHSHCGNTIINNTETTGISKKSRSKPSARRLWTHWSFSGKDKLTVTSQQGRCFFVFFFPRVAGKENPEQNCFCSDHNIFCWADRNKLYIRLYRYKYRSRCTGIECLIEIKRSKVRQRGHTPALDGKTTGILQGHEEAQRDLQGFLEQSYKWA